MLKLSFKKGILLWDDFGHISLIFLVIINFFSNDGYKKTVAKTTYYKIKL